MTQDGFYQHGYNVLPVTQLYSSYLIKDSAKRVRGQI